MIVTSRTAAPAGRHRRIKPPEYPRGTWMRTRTDALRAAITERDLSYRELAVLAGVSASFVAHLLPPRRDPTRRPRKPGCAPETAHAIARALRRPVGELFAETGPNEPSTGPLPVIRP